MIYPKWKYHPEKEAQIVPHVEAEKSFGEGWFDSPAHYGVETCPGITADPAIAKLSEEYKNLKGSDLSAKKPKRVRA